LDKKTGEKIIQLLQRLKEDGRTLVVVSHDARIVNLADKKFHLEQGKLLSGNE
jgi:putative ABC transport system ATP-binding protein